jgi:hypothetical protein
MSSQVIKNTFFNIYRDDFADSDNYHRILFNPGRAVQARELTQLQTMIQREIERFGRNIFKEGAAVNPVANVGVDTNYKFVKIQSVSILPTSIVGNTFTGGTSGVVGKCIRVVSAEGSDPATMYIAYISGGGSGNRNVRFSPGETISDGTNSYVVQSTNTTVNPAVGNGTLATVGSGEFFILGHFVFAESSNYLVSKYTNNPTVNIGFSVSESIITANDDQALYDNQGDLPNTTAPGADRYRIRLSLTTEDQIDSDDTFVYIARIEDGVVVETNNGRTEYNKILDLMAERTFEESGNYTVRAPYASWSADSDSDGILNLRLTKGISYVQGYRVETLPKTLNIDKPNSTETVNNEAIGINYGNYVEVDSLNGLPNLTQLEQWNLIDDSDYGSGSTIGTARIRSIEPTGTTYRFHLFDIRMNSGQNFRDTRSIGSSATKNARIVTERGNAVLKEVLTNDAIFELPIARPSSISDVSLTVQRIFTTITDGSGEASINLTAPGEDFSSLSDWIVTVDSSGDVINPTLSPTTTTNTGITGAPANTSLTIHGFVQKGGSSGSYRTKTLTTSTVTSGIESDGSGTLFVDLGKVDIYQLDSARDTNSSGPDIGSKFRLDNGQRDNFYDHGRLILNANETSPAGNVYVKFKHFTHGGTGNFFCVNSYAGQVEYDEIPTYRLNNGNTVFLFDVLDFRSTINDAGTGFSGSGARVNELPQSTELVTADVEYYLPRKDKLVVNRANGLQYIQGSPEFDPKYPDTPSESMLLYYFDLNANTLNEKDLTSRFVNNRRYTMRDIAKLDEKIEQVRETATLSLLEVRAQALEVLDESGLPRSKAGFLTDDFRDHRSSDVENEEYRAALDPFEQFLTPSFRQKNVGLLYDSAQSTDTVLKGEIITLAYTDTPFIVQPEASRTQNVNPLTRVSYTGTIRLSPNEDNWREVTTITDFVQEGRVIRTTTSTETLFNN